MNFEEIKKKEKLVSKLPKIKVVSYLRHLLTYISQLHERIKLLEKEISDEKIKQINQKTNCPTSKLPEWEDKGSNPKKILRTSLKRKKREQKEKDQEIKKKIS